MDDDADQAGSGINAGVSVHDELSRLLFEQAAEALLIIGSNLAIVSANQRLLDLSMYSAAELAGMELGRLFPEAPGLEEIHASHHAGMQLRRKDGSLYRVDARFHSLNRGGWLLALGDHRYREAQEKLQRANQELQGIIDASPLAIFSLDREGIVTSWSRTAEAVFGWSREEALGRFNPIVGESRRADFLLRFAKVLSGHAYYSDEVQRRCKDGRLLDVSVSTAPLHDIDGRIIGAVGVIEDISVRKRAEAALRASESKLRRLYDTMRDAYASVDMTGRIDDCNDAFLAMLGYTSDEARRLSLWDITPAKWHEMERRIIATQVLTQGYSEIFEKEYIHKNGRVFPVELRASLTRDGAGNPIGIWAIVRDISERIRVEEERTRLQEQLQQSQKMESIGRLAGGVAHDFNNMLEVILGYTELGKLKTPSYDPLYADLQEIEKAAQHSANLTRQLLAFARKQTIAPKVLDLNAAVAEMLKMLGRLIGEDIELRWEPGPELWPVKLDPNQLDQVLANLCVNSRDAVSGAGRITLSTRNMTLTECTCTNFDCTPGEYVAVTISDTGCGMDAGTKAHLFEPFFTTKSSSHSAGLGLATVYGIVKQNKGWIDVESEPGRGTAISIYLPREHSPCPAPGAIAAEGEKTGQPEAKETILLVEDEPAILELGRRMLRSMGYRVYFACTPLDAIALVEGERPAIDLLITDIIMPDMNGPALVNQLKLFFPKLKSLYMSGYPADVIAEQGILEPSVNFLQKPFSMSELAAKAREALDG
jgi:two-component system, cell cycle sensor histidine kinase and response regulator CckA